NYGIYTQNPLLNNIFQNTSIGTAGEAVPCGLQGVPRDAPATAGCGPIIFSDQFATPFLGNPNLEIERTSAYEIGVLSELGENYAIRVVLFNKDQSGLTGVRTGGVGVQDIGATYGTSSPNYQVLVNEDFQTVRGIEVVLGRRLAGYWAFDLNYSFSNATTNAAPPEREFESRANQFDPVIRREIRSEIDIPHVLNGILRYAVGADAPEIRIGSANLGSILKHSNAAVTLQAQSGIPFTPTTNFFGGLTAAGNTLFQLERNSGRGPAIWWVNLKAEKGFGVGNMVYSGFLQVFNLFDTKNCLQPLPSTGRCDAGVNDQARSRQGNTVGETASSTFFDRPQLFGPRREIALGIRVDF
ncbi:MAG: TonB-dependent receptor domain-containing protein, partial [Gemmatimonadota bacterium]